MKKDNSAASAKLMERLRIASILPDSARVLDCFAGSGLMYELCWSRFGRGAALDLKAEAAEKAAAERPTWAVYEGDTEKALLGGCLSRIPFDVIDIDSYGSPWPVFLAWISSCRERAEKTYVVLTDGYMSRASAAGRGCKALFQGRSPGNLTRRDYLAEMRSRLDSWGREHRLLVGSVRTVYGPYHRMAIHSFIVSGMPGNDVH